MAVIRVSNMSIQKCLLYFLIILSSSGARIEWYSCPDLMFLQTRHYSQLIKWFKSASAHNFPSKIVKIHQKNVILNVVSFSIYNNIHCKYREANILICCTNWMFCEWWWIKVLWWFAIKLTLQMDKNVDLLCPTGRSQIIG